MRKVMEDLQGVLHDLQDISGRAGQPFRGIVIHGLEHAYRDFGTSSWTIVIEPSRPTAGGGVEILSPDDLPAEEAVPEEEGVDSNT